MSQAASCATMSDAESQALVATAGDGARESVDEMSRE